MDPLMKTLLAGMDPEDVEVLEHILDVMSANTADEQVGIVVSSGGVHVGQVFERPAFAEAMAERPIANQIQKGGMAAAVVREFEKDPRSFSNGMPPNVLGFVLNLVDDAIVRRLDEVEIILVRLEREPLGVSAKMVGICKAPSPLVDKPLTLH